MAPKTSEPLDRRVLILATAGEDARLSREILARHGFDAEPCGTPSTLLGEIERGAGAVVCAEEALENGGRHALLSVLERQPSWADLPLIVLSTGGANVAELLDNFEGLCNVTLLERPVQIATLVSAVRASLQARERQYEVRDLLVRLQEADRKKDFFLAMLGHELRNPLGVIRTALALLARVDADGRDRDRQIERIHHQVDHLGRMVDDLLDLSRISRGKITLRRHTLDLARVVRRALGDLESDLQARGHRLETAITTEPLWVYGDPVRLEQVFANLIHNAIKYSPDGSAIYVAARPAAGALEVRVTDQGVGIPADQLDSIFESFTQADRSLDRAAGGLGLGLALVRQLVELHGGRVQAESDGPGTGARFTVRLPRAEAPADLGETEAEAAEAPPADPGDPALQRGRPLRVLVVEDLADAREALAELLRLQGYEVATVAEGGSAVESILASPPDVALVDIGLPILDGYQVARRVRAERPDGTLLVAMTGYGQDQDRQRAREAGFDLHLTKPVDTADLFRLLERAGERRAS